MKKQIILNENTYSNIIGPDGAGKDSAMAIVIPQLQNVVLFREPGGTIEAEMIREIILSTSEEKRKELFSLIHQTDILSRTKNLIELAQKEYLSNNMDMMEVYLFAASRSETNEKVVKKSLKEKKAVFGSRSVSCSMAYQGHARGIDKNFIWETNMKAIDRLPDYEIFLDIPTEVAMKRLSNRTGKQDRLDLEGQEFHRKSREGYLEFFTKGHFPVFIVDATQSIEKVAEDILIIIEKQN
jgi:dTMP kinase